ncbi:MAG: hypothetical protein ACK58T_00545, partial [Phycisphaerae bacterium]
PPAARAWLRLLLTLNDRPFADGFDETRAEQYLAAEIVLIVFPIVWKVRHVSFFVGSHCCLKRKELLV